MSRSGLINIKELGERIRLKRDQEKLSLRALAQITEVSPSTLSRIESNKPIVPDAPTLARLAKWLQIPFDQVVINPMSDALQAAQIAYYPGQPMPSIVEAHLRADRNLTPDTARALAELFRVAYEGYCNASKAAGQS